MKKLLSLLVVLSMLAASLSGITLTAAAEDVATTLTPADDGYYYISSAEDFNLIAATEAALTTPGNYRITADITEDITTPIPTFAGTITGWDAEAGKEAYRTINIALDGGDVQDNKYLGLIGTLSGSAKYLIITGTIADETVTGVSAGALAGYATNTSVISNIINKASITLQAATGMVGGIIGVSYSKSISNCINEALVYSKAYTGGIIGQSTNEEAKLFSLVNKGTLRTANGSSGVSGGICAQARLVMEVSDSYNIGSFYNTNGARFGIIASYHTNVGTGEIKITNCYSTVGNELCPESTIAGLTVTLTASYLSSDAALTSEETLKAAGWDFENTWYFDKDNYNYIYPQIQGLPAEEIALAKDSEGYYLIHNAKEFNLIASTNTAANYRIVADITDAITDPIAAFTGTITGWDEDAGKETYRVINIALTSEDHDGTNLGLINQLKGGSVSYLTIEGSVNVTTAAETAQNAGGYVATLVGNLAENAKISHIVNNATVTNTQTNISGGVVGIANGAISDCLNTAKITAKAYAGGIIGQASTKADSGKSYDRLINRGEIKATNAGGLIGLARYVFKINDSYNTGALTGTNNYGIVAYYHKSITSVAATLTIADCYSTTGTALCRTVSTATGCGETSADYLTVDTVASYMTTDSDDAKALKNQATLEAAGWDFSAVWCYDSTNPGYPYPQIQGLPFEAYFPLAQDADGYYLLNTLEDFKQITKITNGLSSKYKITADIEDTIDFSLGSFSGEIIGWDTETNKEAYRTIKIALTDEDHDGTNLGLINQLTGTGSVSYLTLEGSVSVTSSSTQNQSGYVAALVGNLAKTAKISHIINNASVTNARTNFSGGIAGIANGAIADCLNTAKITAKAYAGGIIGQAATMVSYNLSYDRLVNRGEISATNAGGITGAARYAFNINDSYNTGALSGTNCYGIVPYYHDRVSETSATVLTITNCYSTTGTALYRPVTSLENKPSEGNLTVTSVASYLATDEAANEALKSQQTLVAAGWDFEEIWSYDGKNKGYFYPQIKEFYLATTPGTISDPLDIATAAEFYAIKDKADADFYCELVSDIDLTTIEDYVPFDFSGVIYGNDKKITPSASGIFSNLTNATVSDLTIAAATVNGRAALAYDAGNLTLSDIINNADVVSNTDRNGGFIGYAATGKITFTDCVNNGDVDGAGSNNGGFVGDAGQGVEAVNCVNNGDVNGSGNVGGIIGYNTQVSTVTNSINTGNVTSLGDILGQGGAGGILGSQRTDGASRKITITGCYNSGIVSTLKDPNGYGRYNPIISEIRPFDHTGKPVADASFAKVEVSDCYYLAVNPETDLDAYEGTTALSLEAFKAADERLADLTFYQFTVNSPENAYVSPASPSGKVYVKYGSDVIFLACPYDIGYAVDEENTNIPFVKDDEGNYYTYKISNVNFNAEYNIAIKSVVVFGSIKTPDFAVERDALLPYAANGLKDYLKISSDKAGFLLYSSVKDHAGEASEFGFEIEGFKVPVAQKTANGEFGAYIFSSKLDANTKYTVKAYAEIGDETVYSEAVLISPAIPE